MEKSDSAPPAAAPDFTGYTQSAPRRRGFVRLRDIPLDLLDRINRGELETATLTEQAAMDFAALLGSLEGWAGDRAALLREAAALRPGAHGIVARMRLARSEEHTSELQSPKELVCRLLLEKKKIDLFIMMERLALSLFWIHYERSCRK